MDKRIVALIIKCPQCGRELHYICNASLWEGSTPSEDHVFSVLICSNNECKLKMHVNRILALKNIYQKEI